MLRFLATLIICAAFLAPLSAQETPSTESDTTIIEKEPGRLKQFINRQRDLGIYVGFNGLALPTPSGNGDGIRALGGVHFNKWQVEFFYESFFGSNEQFVVFPTEVELLYEHAGVSIGYKLAEWTKSRLYGKVSASLGYVEWSPVENFQEPQFRDDVTFLAPELQYEWILFPMLRLVGAVGYRLPGDFVLPELETSDIGGFQFALGVKVGWFRLVTR